MNPELDLDLNLQRARAVTRRQFLKHSQTGLGAIALAMLMGREGRGSGADQPARTGQSLTAAADNPMAPRPPHFPAKAKRVIYLHMSGGPPQQDLFDYKPTLVKHNMQPCPDELLKNQRFAFIKGHPKLLGTPYKFHQRGQSGQTISDLLPHIGEVVDDIAVIRSMHTDQFNHAPAELFIFTGTPRNGGAAMGSWITYGLGSENQDLPGFVVLISGGTDPTGGKALWSTGFLPSVYQGVQCRTVGDPILYVSDPKGMDRADRRRTLDALRQLNEYELKEFGDPETLTRISQYELAFRMQMSVPDVMDIRQEPEKILEMYGAQPGAASFANNCLLARRLVERGVRYVQLFDWGWDCHGTGKGDDIVYHLPEKCKEIDRPVAALLKDLKRRGLLDETIVVWGGEFGRTSMNEARGGSTFLGRDHHPHCFTLWVAGGGFKPGISARRHRRPGLPDHREPGHRPRPPGHDPPPAGPRRREVPLPLPGPAAAADRRRGRRPGAQGIAGVSVQIDDDRAIDVIISTRSLPPQPFRRVGVAGHSPVAAGREADRADLGPVGHARPLVLLAKEPREERAHGPLDQLPRVGLGERGVLAQEEDLLGRIAAAYGVEEDEVVQLVRAEHRLGGLLDLARGRGRQQLGRDGRLDDREQGFPRRPLGKLVQGRVADQELHQRLGDRAIGVIHAHVVGIVRRPAQRQLREVAGADDEALGHEQERPQSRLDVLERQVAPRLARNPGERGAEGLQIQLAAVDAEGRVADLPERLEGQWCDVDGLRRNAEVAHEVEGVVPGAFGGAEAGHRQPVNQPPVDAQQVARFHRDEQGERRVESAGDPDIQRGASREAARFAWPAPHTGSRRSRRSGGAARALPGGRTACPAPRASGP